MKNRRAIELLMLAGISGDHLAYSLASSRLSGSRLPRTVSSWVFNIFADGDSTVSLGCLCQFNLPYSSVDV